MNKYLYWKPGGETGSIESDSPFNAAMELLNEYPIYCSGTEQPYVYVGSESNQNIKIWIEPTKD